jgi:hypothetical protein
MHGQTRHDTLRNISNGETYLDDFLWRMAHSVHSSIATFFHLLEEPNRRGVRFGKDLIMKSSAKPQINAEISLDCVRTVLRANLAELRRLDEFAEELALFLMDNCPIHITNDIMALLTEERVHVITFCATHNSDLQVLDVTLLSADKRHTRYELPFGDKKATITFIVNAHHDFKQTTVEPNIWGAFHPLDFELDTTSEPYRLLLSEEKLRESAGSQELWSICPPWFNCVGNSTACCSIWLD